MINTCEMLISGQEIFKQSDNGIGIEGKGHCGYEGEVCGHLCQTPPTSYRRRGQEDR